MHAQLAHSHGAPQPHYALAAPLTCSNAAANAAAKFSSDIIVSPVLFMKTIGEGSCMEPTLPRPLQKSKAPGVVQKQRCDMYHAAARTNLYLGLYVGC